MKVTDPTLDGSKSVTSEAELSNAEQKPTTESELTKEEQELKASELGLTSVEQQRAR